jgi:hypothetical protein
MGLHVAAALGATGIFVAAAAVGASQTRQSTTTVASPTAAPDRPRVAGLARAVRPERSVAGTVREVLPNALIVAGPRGQELRVIPDAGALIRLNGKTASLDSLQADDRVVVLGQAQPRTGFVAHAITARRKAP